MFCSCVPWSTSRTAPIGSSSIRTLVGVFVWSLDMFAPCGHRMFLVVVVSKKNAACAVSERTCCCDYKHTYEVSSGSLVLRRCFPAKAEAASLSFPPPQTTSRLQHGRGGRSTQDQTDDPSRQRSLRPARFRPSAEPRTLCAGVAAS